MKKLASVILTSLILSLAACGSSGKESFETAQFEEQQNNKENAIKLYRQILEKHSKSEYAKKAEERLKELEKKK